MRWMMAVVVSGGVLLGSVPGHAESLFPKGGRGPAGGFLFTDARASRLGDTLTILVVENASSNVKGETDTAKDSSSAVDLTGVNLFGHRIGDNMLGVAGNRGVFNYSGSTAHKGSGSIDRTQTVTAQIPARVVKVL